MIGIASVISATAMAIGVGLHAAPSASADHNGHIPIPDGDGEQFVWPTTGWIGATDHYNDGNEHSGSADFTTLHHVPIYPARPGEVDEVGWQAASGWFVRLKHETTGDDTYYTFYSHLFEEPELEEEAFVDLDTPLGEVSKTGNALSPHLHFRIELRSGDDSDPVKIPELSIGDWTQSGEYIPGVYDDDEFVDGDLEPLSEEPQRVFDVTVIEDGLWMYETTGRLNEGRITQLEDGDTVTVTDTRRGQYYVDVDGESGWIPSSGVAIATDLSGIEILDNMNVRRTPDTSQDPIGNIAGDQLLTVYETSGSWSKVLWRCTYHTNRSENDDDNTAELGGCPDRSEGGLGSWKFGWVGSENTQATDKFDTGAREVVTVVADQTVDGESRPDHEEPIGELPTHETLTITDTFNGWYQVEYEGEPAWFRGWFTSGPR